MTEEWHKSDDYLAARLLKGKHDDNHDFVYLKGDDEREGRKALARLLRGGRPLNQGSRRMLAELFDPDLVPPAQRPEDVCFGPQRILKFEFRSKGWRGHHVRDGRISLWMQERVDRGEAANIKDARRLASKQFKLGDDKLKQIWRETKQFRLSMRDEQRYEYDRNKKLVAIKTGYRWAPTTIWKEDD